MLLLFSNGTPAEPPAMRLWLFSFGPLVGVPPPHPRASGGELVTILVEMCCVDSKRRQFVSWVPSKISFPLNRLESSFVVPRPPSTFYLHHFCPKNLWRTKSSCGCTDGKVGRPQKTDFHSVGSNHLFFVRRPPQLFIAIIFAQRTYSVRRHLVGVPMAKLWNVVWAHFFTFSLCGRGEGVPKHSEILATRYLALVPPFWDLSSWSVMKKSRNFAKNPNRTFPIFARSPCKNWSDDFFQNYINRQPAINTFKWCLCEKKLWERCWMRAIFLYCVVAEKCVLFQLPKGHPTTEHST